MLKEAIVVWPILVWKNDLFSLGNKIWSVISAFLIKCLGMETFCFLIWSILTLYFISAVKTFDQIRQFNADREHFEEGETVALRFLERHLRHKLCAARVQNYYREKYDLELLPDPANTFEVKHILVQGVKKQQCDAILRELNA